MQKILITGATGDTGRYTTQLLRERGFDVRAMVHKYDERAEALSALGAEIFAGDLLDLRSVRQALEGIHAAYFVYPIKPGLIAATGYFAQAAREAGLKALVNMSQISARQYSQSNTALDHWTGERIFDRSGIPVTHLRPTFFAEWLTYPTFSNLVQIRTNGLIEYPFGSVKHAPVAAYDQARLISELLVNHSAHAGKTYPLFGPVEMNYFDIAEILSDVMARQVIYRPIEIDEFRTKLAANGAQEHLIQHLCAVAQDYRDGLFSGTNDIIEKITGKPPMSVSEFAKEHKEHFF
ncbi:NmrA family NAD(P)-binding protein [Acerihabitans sp.]|uniref:NmrA family NAD(P)-binding protein n=1 Tax=Acerihabitans sp. TaxID=2811394 RepID=UPI002EDA850B